MTSTYSLPLCTDQQINQPGQQFPPSPWMLSLCLSFQHELLMPTKWEWEKWAPVEFQNCPARHCKKASALRLWAQCMRWFALTAWATVIYPQPKAHQHQCSLQTMQASSRPPKSNHHVSSKTNWTQLAGRTPCSSSSQTLKPRKPCICSSQKLILSTAHHKLLLQKAIKLVAV